MLNILKTILNAFSSSLFRIELKAYFFKSVTQPLGINGRHFKIRFYLQYIQYSGAYIVVLNNSLGVFKYLPHHGIPSIQFFLIFIFTDLNDQSYNKYFRKFSLNRNFSGFTGFISLILYWLCRFYVRY